MSVPLSELTPPPPPPPASECVPHLGNQRNGGATTRLRVRGRGEPIRTTAEKVWHSVYFGVLTIWISNSTRSFIFPRRLFPVTVLHTAKNQYRKFETNIPRNGQFPHSCVCDRFIYSHDRSSYSAVGNM